MPGPVTTNYSWQLPEIGGDADNWGQILNEVFTTASTGLDAVLDAIDTTAAAALPLAGGTTTGLVTMALIRGGENDVAGSEIDWDLGNVFTKTLATDRTITWANEAIGASKSQFITVRITNAGSHSVTWPVAVEWTSGSIPAQTALGTDVYVFFNDAGTIYGARVIEDAS